MCCVYLITHNTLNGTGGCFTGVVRRCCCGCKECACALVALSHPPPRWHTLKNPKVINNKYKKMYIRGKRCNYIRILYTDVYIKNKVSLCYGFFSASIFSNLNRYHLVRSTLKANYACVRRGLSAVCVACCSSFIYTMVVYYAPPVYHSIVCLSYTWYLLHISICI